MVFSSTTKNIPPPLIKNTSRNTTEPLDCSLFPGDSSCTHVTTTNNTSNNMTVTPVPVNNITTANDTLPSIKILSPINGQKIPINDTVPTTTNDTQSKNTTATMLPMNMTMTNTNTTKLPTVAHQCPDGSYADANASCVA